MASSYTGHDSTQPSVFGASVDLSKIPAIHQNRTIAFVNNWLMNNYQHCQNLINHNMSLYIENDLQLQKMDAALSLLEAKLDSVPGLEVTLPSEPSGQDPPISPDDNINAVPIPPPIESPQQLETVVEGQEEQTETTAETEEVQEEKEELDDRYLVFKRRLKVGIPLAAMMNEIVAAGLDPDVVARFDTS